MFSRLSQPGILLDNLRSLSLGLTVSSLFASLFNTEFILIIVGVLMGSYYGYKIEKQTHEFRNLGGRILKRKEWDYLIVA